MVKDYQFTKTIKDLVDSTFEFYYKPEFYREVIRSSPKYFVHVKNGNTHTFGLSKFCAFKNITVEEYIKTYRYKTDGSVTQKHIVSVTNQNWISRKKMDKKVRNSFDNWITNFFPNYQLNNAQFITLKSNSEVKWRIKKHISLHGLLENLKIHEKIGRVGEEIALKFESQRLLAKGIKHPETCIAHISLENAAAGYDIYSSAKKETRFIEVKSSMNMQQEFFITENEIKTLSTLGKDAYLYFVHITNLAMKRGEVFKVYRDPIQQVKENGILKPVVYRAKINRGTSSKRI